MLCVSQCVCVCHKERGGVILVNPDHVKEKCSDCARRKKAPLLSCALSCCLVCVCLFVCVQPSHVIGRLPLREFPLCNYPGLFWLRYEHVGTRELVQFDLCSSQLLFVQEFTKSANFF